MNQSKGKKFKVEKREREEKKKNVKNNQNHQKNGQESDEKLKKSLEMINWYEGKWNRGLGNVKSKGGNGLNLKELEEKYKEAQDLVERVVKLSLKGASSDEKFLANVAKSGTLKDKVAALTLNISEDPLFKFDLLEKLLETAEATHRREASMGIEALKDLFISNILPDRKLINFADRPLDDKRVSDEDLYYWMFEDKVKKYYKEFLNIVEKSSHDQIVNHRQFMIKILMDILLEKPEEEKRIMSAIINKLGDKEKSVASKAVFSLNKIVEKHPLMRIHIATEIQNFLLRPNVSVSSQYYSVIFLNEFVLSETQSQLAEKMIEIYFQLFDKLNEKEREKTFQSKKGSKSKKSKKIAIIPTALDEIKSEENLENKMMTQILIGIRRAFPYMTLNRDNSESFKKHVDDLYRSCHSPSILRSIQAAQLIYLMESMNGTLSDRFYRMLYEKMLASDLSHNHNWTQFLNLLYKSLKLDSDSGRLQSFIKRLLQCCLLEEPGFVCASLILTSAIIKEKPFLRAMIAVAESSKRDSEEKYVDKESKIVIKKEENSDEETFGDVEEEEDYEGIDKARVDLPQAEIEIKQEKKINGKKAGEESDYRYDPSKREPKFAFADETCLWELVPFLNHFHPSVAKYAEQVMQLKPAEYKGDPFADFNRNLFLDRFSYKNPKVSKKKHTSHMQKPEMKSIRPKEPVNSEAYIARREENIPADEKFLYEYFKQIDRKSKDKERFDFDEDASDVDDEEFDRYLESGVGTGMAEAKKKKKSKKNVEDPDMDDVEGLEELLRKELGTQSLDEIEGETMKELEGMSEEEIQEYLNNLEQGVGDDAEEEDEFEGGESDEDEEMGDEEDEIDEDGDDLDGAMFAEGDDMEGSDDDDEGFLESQQDGDSEEEEQPKGKNDKKKKPKLSSAFASADQYAHLLNDVDSGVNPKQLEWEEKKSVGGKKRPPPSRKFQKKSQPPSKKGKPIKRK